MIIPFLYIKVLHSVLGGLVRHIFSSHLLHWWKASIDRHLYA